MLESIDKLLGCYSFDWAHLYACAIRDQAQYSVSFRFPVIN